MKQYGHFPGPVRGGKRYLVVALPTRVPKWLRRYVGVLILIAGSNLLTHRLINPGLWGGAALSATASAPNSKESLYLMDKAQLYIQEDQLFEEKVTEIANMLGIPPEWLMAVMYSESQFNPAVLNHKGSGAVGLIQFTPVTALELGVTQERLKRMDALQQLEYVYVYLQRVRDTYGDYKSLTDVYLGILYPKARAQDYCFTLYGKPSKKYHQNSGLDENKDGRVSVSDIDRRMARLYPTAYGIQLGN